MVWGKVYMRPGTFRSNWITDLGKYVGLEIESIDTQTVPNYKDIFPLGKTPALVTEDGFKLTETISIYLYVIKNSTKPEFAGIKLNEKATNLKWLLFFNSDFISAGVQVLWGSTEEEKAKGHEKVQSYIDYFDNELKNRDTKYLSSDEILVGDIFVYKFFKQFEEFGLSIEEKEHIGSYLESLKEHPLIASK